MKHIKIDTTFITLGQFLKYINIVPSGGSVKFFLAENPVLVDDQKETRRGRKIYPGSTVRINGDVFKIVASED